MVSSRSARKIKDYIVRSKLDPTDRKVGRYMCGNSWCQTCTSIQVTDSFSSILAKSTYKIIIILTVTANVSSTC